MSLAALSTEETAAAIRAGRLSATDRVAAALEAIGREDGTIRAFRETCPEVAERDAAAIDAAIARGEDPGPLAGVPFAVKDNVVTTFGTSTAGSRFLEGYRSPFEATAVARLRAAGAIPVGRTRCDEFGMGSSGEHCADGPTRHPHAPDRVPGGSSSGSAAAVAAGFVPLALGSDTGGSIRQPAAFCGAAGIKPSYGRVSRWGLIAYGSSLEQVGPIASTVAGAALALAAIAGHDERDATSVAAPVPDLAAATRAAPPARIGLPRGLLDRGENDPRVVAAVERAARALAEAGCTIVPVELETTGCVVATYYVLATAEASSNLARYDGVRYGRRAAIAVGDGPEEMMVRSRTEGFGEEVRRRIVLGTWVLSAGYHDAYYDRALRARRLVAEDYTRAFERCDALIGPVAPTPAFRFGAHADPLEMWLGDVYTVGANVAGICAGSVPFGQAVEHEARLPLAVQVQCPAFAEETLLRTMAALEVAGRKEVACC